MKKKMVMLVLTGCFFAVQTAWACQTPGCASDSSASASASQLTNVSVVTPTPQVNASSTLNNSVGVVNSPTTTNSLEVNNSPVNSMGLESSVELSDFGNSGSFSQGGQGGAGGAAFSSSGVVDSGNSVLILDQSQRDIEYQNRQHIQVPGVASAPAAQMFDPWEQLSWNVYPIVPDVLEKGTEKRDFDFIRLNKRIYRKFEPVESVRLVGNLFDQVSKKNFYLPPSGIKVGVVAGVLSHDKSLTDAIEYAGGVARDAGADQIEIIQYGERKNPTLRGSSFGFGAGAAGLLGNADEIALSGGGGTNISESSIVKESQPQFTFVLWRNGGVYKKVSGINPVEDKQSEIEIDKAVKIQ